ncbi:MAG: hypothetical protein ACRCTF_09895 [Bacteroidales bacterium]
MRFQNILTAALLLLSITACSFEEVIYDGPNIVYFDNKAVLREELDELNSEVVFRLVSPLAKSYDREYKIQRAIGSTIDATNYEILTTSVIIPAGSYWGDGKVSFNADALTAQVDTLALRINPMDGQVAQFDDVLKMCVSRRCNFDPIRYKGEYTFFSTMFGGGKTLELDVVTDNQGVIVKDEIKVLSWYGRGNDVNIKFERSQDGKRIVPTVDVQSGGEVQTSSGLLPFKIHTSEMYSYPGLPKSENESFLFTCSGEMTIYLVFGVFQTLDDGTLQTGYLIGSPSPEYLTKNSSPYNLGNSKDSSSFTMNGEVSFQ